jgi:hypothetical protein
MKTKRILTIFAILTFFFIWPMIQVMADTAGPNSPRINVNDSSIGRILWNDLDNDIASDNRYVSTEAMGDDMATVYLKATNFGFSIPEDAIIDGISVDVERKADDRNFFDNAIRLVKEGEIGRVDKSGITAWPGRDGTATYGSRSDLWEDKWTFKDINSEKFGFAISVKKVRGISGEIGNNKAYIDWISITVTYHKPTTPTVTITAAPTTITLGQFSTLTWSSTNATSCSASGDWSGIKPISGTERVTPSSAGIKSYRLNCSGPGGVGSGVATVTVLNLVPITTSISPTFADAGGPGFVLTVNGSNFVSSSIVKWNGSSRATSYVSANRLTASIAASDIAAAGVFLVTVTNPAPGGGTSNAQTFTVNPGAVKFIIMPPVNGTTDNPVVVTVQAQKADNSVDANYQQDVTLDTSGSATGGGLVNIVNGVGTKNISDTVAQTITLSLTDSQATGLDVSSTQQLTFAPGAVANYSLNDVVDVVAGDRAAYTVSRSDQYNNSITVGVSTIYLYSFSLSPTKKFYDAAINGNVITSISIPNGQSSANFWYYDETAGTYTITASDNSSAPDGNININDGVDSINVVAGPVSRFSLDDPGDVNVGTRLGYAVTRKDQFNNIVTSGDTAVYLYSSSVSGLFYDAVILGNVIDSINITNGQSSANFWYYDETAGTYTITASDNSSAPDGPIGIVDATDSVIISSIPIAATRFVIINPADGTVDSPIVVTVQVQDNSGNIDTTYQSDVTLDASGSATGEGLVDIINGVGSLNISDTLSETVNLSLTDSQGTGLDVSSTQDVLFSVGSVKQFSLDDPGDMAAGTRIGYTVIRKDQFGNIVTSGLTRIYLYSLPEEITKKFYDAASGGSVITFVNITDGNSSANFWYYDEHAATSTIVASDNVAFPDGGIGIADAEDQVAVSAGLVAKFILNDPGDMTAATRLGYIVSRQDQFGNLVTAGVTVVYLYTSSSGVNARFYDSAIAGFVVSSIPIDDGNSSANFWYYDENAGNWIITVSDSTPAPNGNTGVIDGTDLVEVSDIPIVATRFVILNPGNSTIGVPLDVTIQAQDDSGNIDTTYQNDVTLNLSGSATGEGLVDIINGVATIEINDTVAETVTLTLSDSEGTGLEIGSSRQAIFSISPIFNFGGGGVATFLPLVGKVSFSGKAYPQAKLSVIAIKENEDQIIKKDIISSADGSFAIELSGLSIGPRAYALLVQDKDNRVTQTKVFNLNLISAKSALEVKNIIISPTIGFPRSTITKGDFLAIVGYAVPGSKLEIVIDGKPISAQVLAGNDGEYKYLYNTSGLNFGSHTISARQTINNGLQSEFSPQKVFFVTNLTVPKTDFNNDGELNIGDWSIFLARWSSSDVTTRMLDDLNSDGKLDATDLSIFIRTLRK